MSKKTARSKRMQMSGEAAKVEPCRVDLARTEELAKMESQINDVYSRLAVIENFVSDLQPAMGEISKEIGPTINELRQRYERDETIDLLKKVGDNIPTFVELLSTMEAVKGMMTDFMPATVKIVKEISDTVNDLRVRFERDETITLLKKVGDNIPTFVELLSTMDAVKGMMADMVPAVNKITHEVSGTVNELRQRFERDETLMILKHIGDNIPVFAELLSLIKPVSGMVYDLVPAVDKITKELSPTINMLREALEKEETLVIIKQMGENLPTFVKLMAFLTTFEKTGHLDLTLEEALTRETEMLMTGLLKCMRKTMHDIEAKPLESGTWKLISSVFDDEVQKGLLMMVSLARNMHECMVSSESSELKQQFIDAGD